MPVVIAQIIDSTPPKKEGESNRGRIKDANGILYQVTKSIAGKVGIDLKARTGCGNTYSIEYKDDTFTTPEGVEQKFRVVQSIVPALAGQQAITPQAIAAQSNAAAQAAQSPYPPAAPYNATKDEDIATLAIAKPQLEKINPGDRATGLHILKQSAMMWRDFKKWQKLGPQTVAEDMDDNLPPGWEKQ
jgi:hypothetical protein